MHNLIKYFYSVLSIGLILSIFGCDYMNRTNPPVAKKAEKKLVEHDDVRIDNYYWLRDRDNPEVINYLKAENNYLENNLSKLNDLRSKLYKEMTGRIKPDEETVPYLENGYFYYARYEEGKEYPIYCRKKGSLDANEQIMLNINEMAKGFDYYQVRGLTVSPDNRYIAFGVDTVSRRKYTLMIKNLDTGKLLPETIANTEAEYEWANDNKYVFYTLKDNTLRPYQLWRHHLGKPLADDKKIFQEPDSTYSLYLSKSKSGKYIETLSYSTLSTEVRLLDADNPNAELRVFAKRNKDVIYYVSHSSDGFYILTNKDAFNFRVMKCPESKTAMTYWKEIIPNRRNVLVEEIETFKDFLVITERKNGLINIRIINHKTNEDFYLDVQENDYVVYVGDNKIFDTNKLRYVYQSLTTPPTTYDYNMISKKQELIKQKEILGGFDSDNYKSDRIMIKARDGAEVPVSIVYRKDKYIQDGGNPLLLYGYGSYGISIESYFRSNIISLLDRGFAFAIAHIRGGQEMGRQWYEDGKLLKKKNTFTDFIDTGDALIERNYTSRDKLCALGGSAGGLLIGAIINMRPDLWHAVIAAVPFVDVVTTMLDESIPLTTSEYDEWGNPHIKKYYDYMLSYSPYDNVKKHDYPAMLVTTGLHDSQVQYWEPAKWVAKLRTHKTGDNPLYLYTQMEAGHSGAAGRYKQYKETALEYAFLIDQVGVEKE
jgi:oligopeptidase B